MMVRKNVTRHTSQRTEAEEVTIVDKSRLYLTCAGVTGGSIFYRISVLNRVGAEPTFCACNSAMYLPGRHVNARVRLRLCGVGQHRERAAA